MVWGDQSMSAVPSDLEPGLMPRIKFEAIGISPNVRLRTKPECIKAAIVQPFQSKAVFRPRRVSARRAPSTKNAKFWAWAFLLFGVEIEEQRHCREMRRHSISADFINLGVCKRELEIRREKDSGFGMAAAAAGFV